MRIDSASQFGYHKNAAMKRTHYRKNDGRALSMAILALLFLSAVSVAIRVSADEWNHSYDKLAVFRMKQTIGYRSGPGNDAESLGTVDKGATVQVSAIENGWCKITFQDGAFGYVFKRYLEPVDPPTWPGGVKPPKDEVPPKESFPEPPRPMSEDEAPQALRPGPEPGKVPDASEGKPEVSSEQIEPVDVKSIATPDICTQYMRMRMDPATGKGTVTNFATTKRPDCYRILTPGDKEMQVTISSKDNNVLVEIQTPAQGRIAQPGHTVSCRTRSAGDKIIVVRPVSASSPYKLDVSIK